MDIEGVWMDHKYFMLTDRVAFVTGASSGIGREIAKVYAGAGAIVWVADIDETGGKQTVQEITDAGGMAHFVHCDVTNRDSIERAVQAAVSENERIDILVNNAGIGFVGSILDTPPEDYERIMNVNAKGVYNVTRAVLPLMLERKYGVIVNMASIASLIGVKDRFAYCASKGAVLTMTKAVALDYVDQGIRCNCICPTRIHTPFVDEYLRKNYPGKEAEVFAQLSAYQPVGRMGKPEEVAYMALYLASDEAAMITGNAFPIDGGKLMG
jgi:NAD(P)-dependent dehydrogenase (short-subunit alcohol dehydrogenase family)